LKFWNYKVQWIELKKNLFENPTNRLDQVECILGLKDNIDELKYSEKKDKNIWSRHKRTLWHH
jgi:hypothetical protein